MSSRIHRRKERIELLKELLGNACVNCSDENNLQFDHVNPNDKTFGIAQHPYAKDIYIELQKCQLLCFTCHWDKTRVDRGLDDLSHGTVNMYINDKCRCEECRQAWRIYFAPKLKKYRIVF